MYTHVLFGFLADCFNFFQNALTILTPLLPFKEITHAYLQKMSITHNKNLNPLLNLLINCISERSAPHISSLNAACTFRFLNFLIMGLCHSSANCSFCGIDLIVCDNPPRLVFLSKKL